MNTSIIYNMTDRITDQEAIEMTEKYMLPNAANNVALRNIADGTPGIIDSFAGAPIHSEAPGSSPNAR